LIELTARISRKPLISILSITADKQLKGKEETKIHRFFSTTYNKPYHGVTVLI